MRLVNLRINNTYKVNFGIRLDTSQTGVGMNTIIKRIIVHKSIMKNEKLNIVFAGVDNVGKSTLFNALIKKLNKHQHFVEPRKDSEIFQLVRDGKVKDPRTSFLLANADRVENLTSQECGKPFVSDRSFLCSLAYSLADGVEMSWMLEVLDGVLEDEFLPDVVIYLSGKQNQEVANDVLENVDVSIVNKRHEAYLEVFEHLEELNILRPNIIHIEDAVNKDVNEMVDFIIESIENSEFVQNVIDLSDCIKLPKIGGETLKTTTGTEIGNGCVNHTFDSSSLNLEYLTYSSSEETVNEPENVFELISYEEYDEEYKPYGINSDDGSNHFNDFSKAIDFAKDKYDTKDMVYRHVWSAVDTEGELYSMLNGRHICNVLHYEVCENPWGTNNHEQNGHLHIEVKDING